MVIESYYTLKGSYKRLFLGLEFMTFKSQDGDFIVMLRLPFNPVIY